MPFLTEKRLLSLETVLSCYGDLMNCRVTYRDWKWTLCVLAIFIGPSAGSAHSQFERSFNQSLKECMLEAPQ